MERSDKMIELIPAFLTTPGKYSDIVLFTKVQLRRNIREFLFIPRADDEEKKEILQAVKGIYSTVEGFEYKDASVMDTGERMVLREKFVLPSTVTNDPFHKGIFFTENFERVIIVGDQDHVKLIGFSQGLAPVEAYSSMEEFDVLLSKEMGVAFDRDFGYLTSSPHYTGTGLTVSAYIHLPGIVVTDRIGDVRNLVTKFDADLKPVYESGGKVPGALFVIENMRTINATEEEILNSINSLVQEIVKMEFESRSLLVEKARIEIEDRIWRAYGVLKYSRCLDVEEFLNLLSAIRMGVGYGILKGMEQADLNRLQIVCQPEHIRQLIYLTNEDMDECVKRAEMVHTALGG